MNRLYFIVSHASWLGSQPCLFSTSTGKVSNRDVETRFIRFDLVRHGLFIRHVVICKIRPNLASARFCLDYFCNVWFQTENTGIEGGAAGSYGQAPTGWTRGPSAASFKANDLTDSA